MKRIPLSFLVIFSAHLAFSQQVDGKKIRVDGRRSLRIDYSSPAWNKNPQEAEVSYVLIKDNSTGKVAKVQMSETGPDTGVFQGSFQVRFGDEAAEIESTPELYLVPRKLDGDISKLEDLILSGTLLRKPYFFRVERNAQLLTIFDSKSQAFEAYNAFMKTGAVSQPTQANEFIKNAANTQAVDKAAIEARLLAEAAAEKARQEKIAAEMAVERQRLEAEELRKQEEMKRQAQLLVKEEREKRMRKAQALAEEAMESFRKGEFVEAEKKFSASIALDPSNQKYYFQHGMSLFRTEQYNKAVVTLGLAEGPGVNAAERDYAIGVCLMKMNDLERAKASFIKVKEMKDSRMSAPAALYAGVIEYQQENFTASQPHFEWVLENSGDPKLDAQADAYIEQIANALQFQKQAERRWSATLNLGLIYDSNILNQNASNQQTGLTGYRGLYGGSLEYRAVYTKENELIPTLTFNDLYSTNTSFQADKAFQDTDPLLVGFNMPWKWKGNLFGSPSFTGVTPGWETVRLNVDATGTRETISHSYYLRNDLTLARAEDYYANYNLELRQDVSTTAPATAADDLSGSKVTLGTTQTFFSDKKQTSGWIIDSALSANAAKGDNNKYNRFDLGGTYLFPGLWTATWTARLGGFSSQYPSHSSSRKDTNLSLTLGFTKPFTKSLTGIFSAAHARNGSTVTTSEYNKTTILAMLSWSGVL